MASFNAPQLVNDLDLELSDGTTTYLGNVFKEGISTAAGTPDKRNNVEQVLLPMPTAGTWTVRVKASAITKASQDFALVVTGRWASARAADAAAGMQPSAAGAAAPTTASAGASGGVAPANGASAGATAPGGNAMAATAAMMRSSAQGVSGAGAAQPGQPGGASTGSRTLGQTAAAGATGASASPAQEPASGANADGGCSLAPNAERSATTTWLFGLAALGLSMRTLRRRRV
jgi:hypothetical protein